MLSAGRPIAVCGWLNRIRMKRQRGPKCPRTALKPNDTPRLFSASWAVRPTRALEKCEPAGSPFRLAQRLVCLNTKAFDVPDAPSWGARTRSREERRGEWVSLSGTHHLSPQRHAHEVPRRSSERPSRTCPNLRIRLEKNVIIAEGSGDGLLWEQIGSVRTSRYPGDSPAVRLGTMAGANGAEDFQALAPRGNAISRV